MSPVRRPPVELVVKLAEGDSRLEETDDRNLLEDGAPFVRFVADLPDGARVRQSFPRFSRRMRAAAHPLGKPEGGASLDRFLRVRLPDAVRDEQELRAVLARLRARPDVEKAVLALPTRPASPAVLAQYETQQDYLAAAPDGVDARSMWAEADGAGVRVCVCDTVYAPHRSLAHVEVLTDTAMGALPASNDDEAYRHGTAALGVIGARPYGGAGDQGTRGVAHGARLAFSTVPDPAGLGDAIDRALGDTDGAAEGLVAGDVLVIEQEAFLPSSGRDKWVVDLGDYGPTSFPSEVNPDVFRAIQVAIGRGITVVEPAGNGCGSLDGWYEGVDPDGELFAWDPDAEEDDSGAVLVGGGLPGEDATTRVRWLDFDGLEFHGTNYGPRVDCHASALKVVSPCCRQAGIPADVLNAGCADDEVIARWLSATSAATAIVGGAVALLQAAHKRRTGVTGLAGVAAHPLEIRALLRNDAYGTPQTFRTDVGSGEEDPAHRVGPQPDLAKLAGTLPSEALVWLKDDLRELDYRSRRFYKFVCPDILVSPPIPPPPPFHHPEWRGRAIAPADATPGGEARVRVRNRTPQVQDVEASLWWSEPSPFLHPRFWKPLGSMFVDDVPVGGVGVSKPWRLPASIPRGSLSWIAGVRRQEEDFEMPGADTSTDAFLRLLRGSGRLRMLSRLRRPLGRHGAEFPMRLRGMPEGPAGHELRFDSRLPGGALVTVEADPRLADVSGAWTLGELRRHPLRVRLDADDDVDVLIRLAVPPGPPFAWTALAIDQIVDGRQLGRITFEVARGVAADDVS